MSDPVTPSVPTSTVTHPLCLRPECARCRHRAWRWTPSERARLPFRGVLTTAELQVVFSVVWLLFLGLVAAAAVRAWR